MSDLDEVLEQIDAEWLLQREGVAYKESYGRSGRQLNIRECPFCHKKEYRVYINAETMVGNCFSGGCPQKTWSKWTFLKGLLGLEGRQLVLALHELAREQGWRPKVQTPLTIQDLNELSIPKSTPAWEMDPPVEYLARRGVFADLCEYFQLYWSENGAWEYADPRGFTGKQDYSNRIIIPVFDLDGTLVSFQGRDTTGQAEQRYLFPPGFASAGSYLYNGYRVEEGVKTLVICEGVFDVIHAKAALNGAGMKDHEPVGTFGMHLSTGNPTGDDQMGRLRKLKREKGVTDIVFLWDGEQKALNAAADHCLALTAHGFNCRVAMTPDGTDPGSLYHHVIVETVKSAPPCRSRIEALRIKQLASRYKTA